MSVVINHEVVVQPLSILISARRQRKRKKNKQSREKELTGHVGRSDGYLNP